MAVIVIEAPHSYDKAVHITLHLQMPYCFDAMVVKPETMTVKCLARQKTHLVHCICARLTLA